MKIKFSLKKRAQNKPVKQLVFRDAPNDLVERAAKKVIEQNKQALLILKDR